jgi:hypothetical protein
MTKWATIHIQLLISDRGASILHKALKILDALSTFHAEVIGPPNWPSINPKHMILFLLKLYLHGNHGSSKELLAYLELSQIELLNLGAKIISNNDSDETAKTLIESIQLSDFDIANDTQYNFVTETLTQFDQIIRTVTIDTWLYFKEKTTQTKAVNNLKPKMEALDSINATAATALAIAKAGEKLQETESNRTHDNIRISALEKNLKRQEQRTNEIANTINKNNHTKRKNSKGSQTPEPLASPTQTVPQQSNTVDLTLEDEAETVIPTPQLTSSYRIRAQKKQRRSPGPQYTHQKSVQWKNEEVNFYNPSAPAAKVHPTQFMMNHIAANHYVPLNTPLFPPAPTPPPALAPSPNPFFNQQQNIFNTGAHNQFLQNQNPFLNPPPMQQQRNVHNDHNEHNSRYKQNHTRKGQNKNLRKRKNQHHGVPHNEELNGSDEW